MGFADKLKSFFIEIEEDAVAVPAPAAAPAPLSQPSQPSQPVPVPATEPSAGVEDKQIAAALAQAVADANTEGFDYFEFAQLLQNLKTTLAAEPQLFQAAYTSSKVMGVDKAKLLQSAKHYLEVLARQARQFDETVQEQVKQSVTALEQELVAIDKRLAEKQETIRTLQAEMAAMSGEKSQLSGKITANRARIENVRTNFLTTYTRYKDRIEADVSKINHYIIEGEQSNG